MKQAFNLWRFWLGRNLIHLGLWVMPPGRVRSDLSARFLTWSIGVTSELAARRACAVRDHGAP